MLYWTNKN